MVKTITKKEILKNIIYLYLFIFIIYFRYIYFYSFDFTICYMTIYIQKRY